MFGLLLLTGSGLLWLIGSWVFFILDHNLEAERRGWSEDPVNNKSPNIFFATSRQALQKSGFGLLLLNGLGSYA